MTTRRKPSSRKRSPPIGVRLPEPIRRKLEYLASANGITISEAIRRLIEFAQPEDLDLELRSNGLHYGAPVNGGRHGS